MGRRHRLTKERVSIAILILYALIFNLYLYKWDTGHISDSQRRIWCYGCYSILILEVIYFLSKGVSKGLHNTILCASLFVLIYTYFMIILNYTHITKCIFENLFSFNIGVAIGCIIIFISFVRNR